MSGDMKKLVGRKILSIWIKDGEETLVFETNKGDIFYTTYGDCCSETWFADITGVDALIGGTVRVAETVDFGYVTDDRTRQELDNAYGVKIVTDKGYADIVFRNSSNGHYGGGICYPDYTDEANSREGFKQITDDWQAGAA